MSNKTMKIDLVKLALYILKRCWLVILCAVIGYAGMYYYTDKVQKDTYSASGTMYVYNGNPNLINYQYTNSSDLNSAVQLLDTYMVVVKSNKVMDAVVQRLAPDYPGITAGYIAATLSIGSVVDTGVLRVRCVTDNAQKSADICNAVLDVAPAEIIRVVSAGNIEIIDYATAPRWPDGRGAMQKGMRGAMAGVVAACALLALLFLLNQKVKDVKELSDRYTPPVLSAIRREKNESPDAAAFILDENSSMETTEAYAKLRMNLMYTLVGKDNQAVVVTSAISGEGKSTIAANLAISCAQSGRKVLLVDADMRRACQRDVFHYDERCPGLSDVLVGTCEWRDALLSGFARNLMILPAGKLPPNPAELLDSEEMKKLLADLQTEFDLILLDVPPINIVSDPLALASITAGCIFVIRQDFSDHREVRRALTAAEMTGMNMLGFVFYGEKVSQGRYYSRHYYKGYYHKYDNRNRYAEAERAAAEKQETKEIPDQPKETETADKGETGTKRHRRSKGNVERASSGNQAATESEQPGAVADENEKSFEETEAGEVMAEESIIGTEQDDAEKPDATQIKKAKAGT